MIQQFIKFLASLTSSTSSTSSYNPGSTSSQVWETGLKTTGHFELLLLLQCENEEAINEVLLYKLLDADDYEQSKMEAFLLLRDGGTNLKLFMRCVLVFWSSNSKQQQRVRQRIFKLLSSPKLAASFDSPSAQKELLNLVMHSIHAAKFRQECSSSLELMVSNDSFLNAMSQANILQELVKSLNSNNRATSFLLFCCGVRPKKLPIFLDGKEKGEGEAVAKSKESPEFVKRLVRLAQKQNIIETVVASVEKTPLAAEILEAILSSDQSSPIVEHTRNVLYQNKHKWFRALSQALKNIRWKKRCTCEEDEAALAMSEIWIRILTLYIEQSKDFDLELGEIFSNIEQYPNVVLLHLLDLAALLCTMKGVCNKIKKERILVNTFMLLSIPRNDTVSAKLVTIFTAAASRPKIDLLEHILHDCQLLYYFAESCNNNSHYHPIFLEIGIRFIYLSRVSEKFGNSCEQYSHWQDIQKSALFKFILKQVPKIDRNSKEAKEYEATADCPKAYVMILFEYGEGEDTDIKETYQVSQYQASSPTATTVRPFAEPETTSFRNDEPSAPFYPFYEASPAPQALPSSQNMGGAHVPPQSSSMEILESISEPISEPLDTKHYTTEWRKLQTHSNEEVLILVLRKSHRADHQQHQ